MPYELSSTVMTASGDTGCVKEGQPVPDSKLDARGEERVATAGAHVGSGLLGTQEAAGVGALGPVLTQDGVLFGREAFSPLVVTQDEFFDHDSTIVGLDGRVASAS